MNRKDINEKKIKSRKKMNKDIKSNDNKLAPNFKDNIVGRYALISSSALSELKIEKQTREIFRNEVEQSVMNQIIDSFSIRGQQNYEILDQIFSGVYSKLDNIDALIDKCIVFKDFFKRERNMYKVIISNLKLENESLKSSAGGRTDGNFKLKLKDELDKRNSEYIELNEKYEKLNKEYILLKNRTNDVIKDTKKQKESFRKDIAIASEYVEKFDQEIKSRGEELYIRKSEIGYLNDEIDEYKTKVNDLLLSIDSLKEELEIYRQENSKMNKEFAVLNKKYEDLLIEKNSLELYNSEVDQSGQNNLITPIIKSHMPSSMQSIIHNLKLENQRLSEENKIFIRKLENYDSLNSIIHEQNSKIASLESENRSIKEELHSSENKYTELLQDTSESNKNYEAMKYSNIYYEGKIKELEDNIRDLTEKNDNYQKEHESFVNERKAILKKNEELVTERDSLTLQIESIKATHEKNILDLTSKDSERSVVEEELKEVRKINEDQYQHLANICKEKESLERVVSDLKMQLSNSVPRLTYLELESKAKSLEDSLESSKRMESSYGEIIQLLNTKYNEQATARLQVPNSPVNMLKTISIGSSPLKIDPETNISEEFSQKSTDLQPDYTTEIQNLNEQLKIRQIKILDYEMKIQRLNNQCTEYSSKVLTLEEQNKTLRIENDKAHNENNELKEKLLKEICNNKETNKNLYHLTINNIGFQNATVDITHIIQENLDSRLQNIHLMLQKSTTFILHLIQKLNLLNESIINRKLEQKNHKKSKRLSLTNQKLKTRNYL